MWFFRTVLFFVVSSFAAVSLAAAQDKAGSSDHPLVGRYEGSIIKYHQVKGYEETFMLREPLTSADRNTPQAKSVAVAGKLTSIMYEGPENRSALEVVRNYQGALEGAGFETVFYCRTADCGYASGFWDAARGGVGLLSNWSTNTYALLRLERPQGRVWVSLFAIEFGGSGDRALKTQTVIRVVEEQPIETGKIELVKADKLAQSIVLDGRVALYGIEFDHDSDIVKASSDPQIAEIAAYLKSNPQANVLVVGHTDTTGAFDYNRGLSERRAAAVIGKLTGAHGISAARLFAVGVGPASPIATNRTEEGRAKNRRVEIVELPKAQ